MKTLILTYALTQQCNINDIQFPITTFKHNKPKVEKCELSVMSVLDMQGNKITLTGCEKRVDKIAGLPLKSALQYLLNK